MRIFLLWKRMAFLFYLFLFCLVYPYTIPHLFSLTNRSLRDAEVAAEVAAAEAAEAAAFGDQGLDGDLHDLDVEDDHDDGVPTSGAGGPSSDARPARSGAGAGVSVTYDKYVAWALMGPFF